MKPVQICCCSKYYTQTMCTILKCFFILVDVTNPFSQESDLMAFRLCVFPLCALAGNFSVSTFCHIMDKDTWVSFKDLYDELFYVSSIS